jgi:hypothetical protein
MSNVPTSIRVAFEEGISYERERVKRMIQKVIDNPNLKLDSIPTTMALQVLIASIEPDKQEEEEGETND